MKKVRKFLATALAVAMSLSMSVPAFAAEAVPDTAEQPAAIVVETPENVENGDDGISPLIDYDHTIGPNWRTIATGNLTGKTIRIDVHDFNWSLHQVNVRYFHNGVEMAHINEYDNVTGAGGTASVTCAAGATEMQMQIVPRFWGVQDHWYHVSIGNY